MPYEVRSVGKGKYKVFKKNSKKSFSEKGLTKEKAEAQMRALYANEGVERNFVRKIDEALGLVTKGPTKGATQMPSVGSTGDSEGEPKKKKKKKATKIEDEVLEAG